MNPLRLSATNYRTFERLDLELPSGCVAIVGENGAGKSSILNLVDVALFAERGELPGLLTVGDDELELQLEFEHAGEVYRVRRQFLASGRGKTVLDFERLGGGMYSPPEADTWESLTRETAAATQEAICQTIGLSRTTFRASSFLAQGDGAAFTEAQPRDRKAILAEILGLAIWDDLLNRVRTDLRVCEDGLLETRGRISAASELAGTRPDHERERKVMIADQVSALVVLADAERELEQAQQARAAAQVAGEKVRACEAEHRAAADKHERARAELAEAVAAGEQLADRLIEFGEVSADAERIPELEARLGVLAAAALEVAGLRQRRDELGRTLEQRELARGRMVSQGLQLHEEAQVLRSKAGHLEQHIGEASACDRCGQTLGAEAAARAAASYRADAAELDAKAAKIDTACEEELRHIADLHEQHDAIDVPTVEDPAPVEMQLRAARAASERRAQLGEMIAQLTDKSGRAADLRATGNQAADDAELAQHLLDKARAEAVDETPLQARVERWRIGVQEARTMSDRRKADVIRADQQLERIVEAELLVVEHTARIEATQQRVDALKLAERAFGRDGIPALIVENAAIPQLEVEANRILGELGGATAGCRVELRTQRALKTSDALRETLDIVIVTPTGERPYESFSGGERTRLNLALRIALARLLANRRGAESRLLAIDEPDGLDAEGMERLSTVLAGLAGTFERILIVSHNPALSTAFDQTITVTKDGDSSRIDVGAVAVAA